MSSDRLKTTTKRYKMKNVFLGVLLTTTTLSYAQYFCALGNLTPTQLIDRESIPYATMHTDYLTDGQIQLTITSNYESISDEVLIATPVNGNEPSILKTVDGKLVKISGLKNGLTTIDINNSGYACEKLGNK